MATINSLFCKFSDILDAVEFFINNQQIKMSIRFVKQDLKRYLQQLNGDELYVYMEYPYVDKVYRDSYYHYYSTKNKPYDRNCIRVSLFSSSIQWGSLSKAEICGLFREAKKIKQLKDSFQGYITIRPTPPRTIGRSMISPNALKNKILYCCTVETNILINGIKLSTDAFPHCPQDGETMTCAETTIWTVMEYFSNRYPEYNSILPFGIIASLERFSFERQIPSHGLSAKQISFALKEFGFGVRLYSKKAFGNEEFRRILNYYVESGLPVISVLQNYPYEIKKIGHGVVIVGHGIISKSNISNLEKFILPDKEPEKKEYFNKNKISLYDSADIQKEYVIVDDNRPLYQLADYNKPTEYYEGEHMKNCEITNIVVPLYPKIYFEALEARKFAMTLIPILLQTLNEKYPTQLPKEILFRFLLTSSRSFKNQIALNETIRDDVKDLIIEKPMPKFVWVMELSNKELFTKEQAIGQLLIDATEASPNHIDALIYFLWPDYFITWENENFVPKNVKCSAFAIYKNNLKHFVTIQPS